jgi:phosphoglycolate phosphatase
MTHSPQIPCRLFIFDLDGTLIDSRADIARSVNEALKELGLPAVETDKIADFVGNGVRQLMTRVLGEALGARPGNEILEAGITSYLAAYERGLLVDTKLYPGTPEALEKLWWSQKAVITNKPERFSRRILEGLGAARFFETILGGDSMLQKKPDPAPLRFVMDRCGVSPADTVMVGDSLVDIAAGKAAGTLTCGITGGFRPGEELEGAGCDVILDSVAGLPSRFRPPD